MPGGSERVIIHYTECGVIQHTGFDVWCDLCLEVHGGTVKGYRTKREAWQAARESGWIARVEKNKAGRLSRKIVHLCPPCQCPASAAAGGVRHTVERIESEKDPNKRVKKPLAGLGSIGRLRVKRLDDDGRPVTKCSDCSGRGTDINRWPCLFCGGTGEQTWSASESLWKKPERGTPDEGV